MIIRVPLLLQKSVAIVHRLDISGTRTFDPPGEDTSGYDETANEPVFYDDPVAPPGDQRTSSRQELASVRIPCQVENLTEERLRQMGIGDAGISNIALVFHRRDLKVLGLLDVDQEILIKKGDRVSHLEEFGVPPGKVIKRLGDNKEGLFVEEVRGRSWGFGPSGYDLEIIMLKDRREGPTT